MDAIDQVIHTYVRALRDSDPAAIRAVFLESALITGAPGGRTHVTPAWDLADFVSRTPAPATTGEPEDMSYEILAQTPSTASVRFRVLYLGIYVTDLLLLARFTGGWRIVAKVFHEERA